jgi:hypothetical protein
MTQRALHVRSEAGASLVAVMVAVALLAITAMLSSQAFKQLNTVSRQVETSMAAQDVESILVQALVRQYRDYILVNRCNAPASSYFTNISLGQIGTANVGTPVFRGLDGNPGSAPSLAQADVQRCTSRPFVPAGTQTKVANTFYSCLNITTSSAALSGTQRSRDAFAAHHGAFLEIFVKIRNLQTDALATCNNVLAGKGFGIEFYYALHWVIKDSTHLNYDTKVGTLNVSL